MRPLKNALNMHLFGYVFCLSLCSSAMGNVFTGEEETRIKSYINTMIECQNITGLNLAVTKNGEVFTDGFGLANIERNEPVTKTTKMNIGSITKSLTSIVWAAVISAEKESEDSSLDWNTKVQKILGKSFELNNDCLTELATLEDFMSHRTGLDSADMMVYAEVPEHITRAELMKNIKYLQSSAQFRDIWHYCNACYAMVGYLLEIVTKESWEQSMMKRMFVPLNMTSTDFISAQVYNELATPYVNVKGKGKQELDPRLYRLDQFGPAGSICTTADDMSKIMKWITTKEYQSLGISKNVFESLFEQNSFVDSTFREYYSLSSSSFPISVLTYGYGKGWILSKFRGFDMYYHTGGFHGFTAILGFIPSQNISVFINSNGMGNQLESGFINSIVPTVFYLFDTLLGLQPWLNETTACTYPSPWKDDDTKYPDNETDTKYMMVDNPSRFYGNYSSPFYGDFYVYEFNDTLNVKYGIVFQGTLSHHSGGIFNLTISGPLADVLAPEGIVEFEHFNEDVFTRVRLNKHILFDRIKSDTSLSNELGNGFLHYFVSVLLVLRYVFDN